MHPVEKVNSSDLLPEPQINRTDNNTYSLSATGAYFTYLGGGQLSASIKYNYQHVKNFSQSETTSPFSNQYLAYVGWSRSFFQQINAMGYIGANVDTQHIGDMTRATVSPYLNLYADYWPEGIFKGFSPQLTFQYTTNSPTLSFLTPSRTSISYNFYYNGNPALRNSQRAMVKFSLLYSPPRSQNYAAFVINSRYHSNPIASVLFNEEDVTLLSLTNLKYIHNTDYYLYGSLYPVKWLKISPYIELYTFKYNTPSTRIRAKYLRYGGSITFMKESWSATIAANSPTKEYSGDLITEGCAQYSVSTQYKFRNWAFGLQGNFRSSQNRILGQNQNFHYQIEQKWRPLYYLTRINIVYSFSIGRARQHLNQFINETIDNSGLNKYNTPQIQ